MSANSQKVPSAKKPYTNLSAHPGSYKIKQESQLGMRRSLLPLLSPISRWPHFLSETNC